MFRDLLNKPNLLNGVPISIVNPKTGKSSKKIKATDMALSHSMDVKVPSRSLTNPSEMHPMYASLPNTPTLSPDLSFTHDPPPEEDQEQELSTPPISTPHLSYFPVALPEPPLFVIREYQALKRLGTGAFSEVYLASTLGSSKNVALKLIPRISYSESTFTHEISILRQLNHPNIVQLIDSFMTEEYFVFVQEFIPDGELLNLVANHQKDFTENYILQLFRQCVDAVAYLHEKGFAHRDIKLENFLVNKNDLRQGVPTIKLCDFGFAVACENISINDITKVGSDEYIAPELIVSSDRGHDVRSSDIWSLGVTLYTLVIGYLPFSYDSPQTRLKMFHRIASGDFQIPTKISSEFRTMIRGLLKTNPRQRTPVSQIFSNLDIVLS